MIVIRDVDWVKVDGDFYEQHSFERPMVALETKEGPELTHINAVRELVQGRHYINQRGEKVVIGMTLQAQEILGLKYEVWENERKENENLRHKLSKMQNQMIPLEAANTLLKEQVNDIQNGSFWTRLKFLLGI